MTKQEKEYLDREITEFALWVFTPLYTIFTIAFVAIVAFF